MPTGFWVTMAQASETGSGSVVPGAEISSGPSKEAAGHDRFLPSRPSAWILQEGNAPAEPPADGAAAYGLDRGDRRFVSGIALVALILMMVHWVRLTQWRPSAIELDRPEGAAYRFVLDANTATWVEWMQLEGIGEQMARRIVADREQHGPFADVDALLRVPGIGPAKLAAIRRHVVVGSDSREPTPRD